MLQNPDAEILDRITLLSDGLMKNGEMWLTLVAFVAVILVVNLIRTRMFDYAWRTAIVAGGVIYVVIMLSRKSFYEFHFRGANDHLFCCVCPHWSCP